MHTVTFKPLAMRYRNAAFLRAINALYSSEEVMQATAALFIARKGVQALDQLTWGSYQAELMGSSWTAAAAKTWDKSVASARESLSRQRNTRHLFRGSTISPATRLELLDEAVRHCFRNHTPIKVRVSGKTAEDPNPKEHAVRIQWDYDKATGKPVRLHLTMICPN